jgi:hypothetical protein
MGTERITTAKSAWLRSTSELPVIRPQSWGSSPRLKSLRPRTCSHSVVICLLDGQFWSANLWPGSY